MAGALHHLQSGGRCQFGELVLQGGQQLASHWLLTDGEHAQREIAERCGGVQLIAAY